VLYYLNDGELKDVFRFIADKENGFVTFFMKPKILENMINDVINQGGEPPSNKLRKVVFKMHSGLNINEKLSIVGKLIGRTSRVDDEAIYQCMLDINELGKKITISRIAGLLDCSSRTIHRNMNKILKQEKKQLNEEL
tara:strand:- start:322 stop:735 length:414 start_codon:yes stop_codon:yes gene_type:complete